MSTQLTKAEKKIRKAVYLVDISVNNTKDIAYARRKAASYQHWLHSINKFSLVNGRLI